MSPLNRNLFEMRSIPLVIIRIGGNRSERHAGSVLKMQFLYHLVGHQQVHDPRRQGSLLLLPHGPHTRRNGCSLSVQAASRRAVDAVSALHRTSLP